MKKIFFIFFMIFILIGCYSPSNSEKIDPSSYVVSGEIVHGGRIINVEAFRFGYAPEYIVVNQGDSVRIKLTTRDVTHGFMIEKHDINEQIKPGEEKSIEFKAEKKGLYEIRCNVPCGPGHGNMRGTLIVK